MVFVTRTNVKTERISSVVGFALRSIKNSLNDKQRMQLVFLKNLFS